MNLAEYGSQHRTRQPGLETGTVKKVRDKWIGYYHTYKLQPDGTKKRIGRKKLLGLVAQMTKTDAKRALADFLRSLGHQPKAQGPVTFGHVAEKYLTLRKENWSESYERTMRSMFKHLLLPVLRERPISEITAEELKRLIDTLPARQWRSRPKLASDGEGKRTPLPGKLHHGISTSYVGQCIAHLRAIFDLAQEQDLIGKNPARSKSTTLKLQIPKRARTPDKSILPPHDFLRLLEVLERRERIIMWIAMLGGNRPNEIFALKVEHVGVDRLYVEGALDEKRRLKETKTGKVREVLLPPMVRADLGDWIRSNRLHAGDWLFSTRRGTPLNRQKVLQRKIRKAALRAQIRTLDVDFQMMRRSFATVLVILGGDVKSVQGQMGHSQPRMTLDYAQSTDVHLAAQLARAERILRGMDAWPEEAYAKMTAKGAQRETVQ